MAACVMLRLMDLPWLEELGRELMWIRLAWVIACGGRISWGRMFKIVEVRVSGGG